ncbi:type I polyketide synthase [Methylocystis sp. SB2]|uniref:type I polyketide synthase n=1 Tax=Methylocystis sp. (strain SB2) TaxID=743836 RepID=UPI0003FF1FAC|nr:type I polyketide synthase [Methylocystis sp. SB2]
MGTVIAITPSHCLDPQIAIAACKAGETGVLDLGWRADASAITDAINALRKSVGVRGTWGVRWDAAAGPYRDLNELSQLTQGKVPLLVFAGVKAREAADLLKSAKELAQRVLLEVHDLDSALLAEAEGFDGLIVKGHEAGGWIGSATSFILLQELSGKVQIPYWIQGGVHMRSAAAAVLSGARGVVLAEQLWLTEEGPSASAEQKKLWSQFDGSETIVAGRGADLFRLSARHGRGKLRELEVGVAKGDDLRDLLRRLLAEDALTPLAQDIAFAASLGRRYGTTGRVIAALRDAIAPAIGEARAQNVLRPDSALAKLHGARFPIVQGPMTRVSDVAPFADAVSRAGGLPFLALAVMRGVEVRSLLTKTKELMGARPWGVGILGFMPLDLRQEQMEAIRDVKPPFAIVAGGRPSQAKELEALGISTYLHVPSPGLLQGFIKEGARKFIFEGSECGGHTGPRTSFVLWESAIETLLSAKIDDPETMQILFAGGIHNGLSAAIVSVLAAPLAAKGMKVGVLMGTAYLFTEEAVRTGAIVNEFQDQAIDCRETALLQSGVGSFTRCANTSFCDEFDKTRRDLILQGKSEEEILMALELLNIGRLRIASKGVARNENPAAEDNNEKYVSLDADAQRREGMYMMGEVARLRDSRLSMAELHQAVSSGAQAALARGDNRKSSPKREPREEIAVVGMACLLPGANDVRSYWRNIMLAIDSVREVTEDRWRASDFYDSKRGVKDKVYSKWGGFLDDVAFDPTRYGIPPASLRSIEPVQLLALLVSSMALEDAGLDRRPFPRERTATIFASGGMNDLGTIYIFRTLLAHYLPKAEGVSEEARKQILESLYQDELPKWTEDSFPGFLGNVVAGRVANRLDLRGANFTVDAACASSLAALDVGIRQLRSGDADIALVGAVDGTNGPVSFMSFAQTHALSPRGRCRPFDDSADGIAIGEGVCAVVLKRLADAERDGDRIYSVIKGIGSSSDGHNRSLTAPHPEGQVLALERAYADAGVDPSSVTLIEAHGTGTSVGDKSEIGALNIVFGSASGTPQRCAVGSVKSMIGHTKVAAGLAALIKASLALKHRVLPPTIGVEKPVSGVDFAKSPFYINTEIRPWLGAGDSAPRRCGVSAFGFGGTNFHTVLEEYRGDFRASDAQDLNPRAAEIFAFSRSSVEAVEDAARTLLQGVEQTQELDLAQLAYSASLDDARLRPKNGGQIVQLAIVANSVADLKGKLEFFLRSHQGKATLSAPSGIYYRNLQHRADSGAVCFLFPGQGSQQINMLRDLVLARPSAYALFEKADAMLKGALPKPLSQYVYPVPVFGKEERERRQAALNDTRVAQPALGLAGLAAYDALSAFGVKPNFVAGHSYGEYVALCVAGVLSREDLIRISDARGRISKEISVAQPATMAAVNANEAWTLQAIARLELAVSVANLNAPDQTIIAGPIAAIDAAVKALSGEDVRVKRLPVTAAFHCNAMAGAQAALAAELGSVTFRAPTIKVFSNTTGDRYPEEPSEIRALLARHIVEPLRFVDEIERLYAAGARVFIEAGPGQVLSGLVGRILGDRPHTTLSIDAPERSGWLQLAQLLARAFALGLPVDLAPWFARRGLAEMSLAQVFEQARAKANPGPMAWRVNGGRAEPWRGEAKPPKRAAGAAAPAPVKAPAAPLQTRPNGNAAAHPPSAPLFGVERERSRALSTHVPSPALGAVSALGAESRFAQVQNSLAQLIDLQREQQDVLRRFFEFQGQLLGANGNGAAERTGFGAEPIPFLLAEQPMAAPTMAGVFVPPAPVLPKLAVTQNGKAPQPAPRPASAPVAAAPVATKPAANGVSAAKTTDQKGPKQLASTEAFKADLLQAVVERTGYTEDMLDLDAHMEADLGIDSIKRIEILSKLKDDHSFMENQDEEKVFEELSGLKTLNAIVDWYDQFRKSQAEPGGSDSIKKAQTPLSLSLPETAESDAPKANPADVQRYAVTPVAAPRDTSRQVKDFPADRLILVVGGAGELSVAFSDALRANGHKVWRVTPGGETRLVDNERIEANLSSLDAVTALREMLADEGAKVGAIFNLSGLQSIGGVAHDARLDHARQLFLLLKAFEKDLRESAKCGGGVLFNLTDFDGQFGLRRARPFAAAPAGTLGVAKSAAREWPELRVKCIDADPDIDVKRLVDESLMEFYDDDPTVEVGFTQSGRFQLELAEERVPTADLSGLSLEHDGVLLVTGGAYGITADVTRAMAEKFRSRLILVGRSPMPGEEPDATRGLNDRAELRQFLIGEARARGEKIKPAEIESGIKRILKDRQIRNNIAAMRSAGAQVEYHALDIRDGDAFGRLIDSIYDRYGRIDGVLHGAGIIDDRMMREKSPESFDMVFETKVIPAMVLSEKLRPETLKFLVFFSSIAGRFGNAGQSDYSAANEVVNKLADGLSHKWPHVHAVAINWGPWDGGMVNDDLRKLYASKQIYPIAVDQGMRRCLEELERGNTGAPEIVVAASLEQIARQGMRQQ